MDDGPVRVESAERHGTMPAPRDVPIRDAPPPPAPSQHHSSRSHDDYHHHSHHAPPSKGSIGPHEDRDRHRDTPPDVWAGAINRIQTQVSYNTSMLESQRRQITDCEAAVARLGQDLSNVIQTVERLRMDMRSRPPVQDHVRHDPGDLGVLVDQLASVTSKANEVDELKMSLKLMKNQVKRIEEHLAVITPGGVPPSSSVPPPPFRPDGMGPASRRASMSHENPLHAPPVGPHRALPPQPQPPPPPPPHQHQHHHHQGRSPRMPQHPQPLPPPVQHHVLPPARSGSLGSPGDQRPNGLPAPPGPLPSLPLAPVLHSQRSADNTHGTPPQAAPLDLTKAPPGPPNFRPAEPLPGPASISGWRPAEPSSHYPSSVPPPPPPPSQQQHHSHHHGPPPAPLPGRPHAVEPDLHASGWAAVNAAQPAKRPYDEPRPSPYGSPVSGSPKRPKLAPIMPRAMHGDDPYASSYPSTSGADAAYRGDSRAASDASQIAQSQGGPPGEGQAYRFITSTSSGSTQDSSRPEHERILHVHPQIPGRGGRGGGRRGGRGRGRGRHTNSGHLPHLAQRLSTPPEGEWSEWGGGHPQPPPPPPGHPIDGHYAHMHVYSPNQPHASLGRMGDRDHDHEMPVTPAQMMPGSPNTAGMGMLTSGMDVNHTGSGSKKTRTKPIRNADGVLIRKDGRPDMRSVSSANNLRKVHAKKDIGRADGDSKNSPDGRDHSEDGGDSPATQGSATEATKMEHELTRTPSKSADPADQRGRASNDVSRERERDRPRERELEMHDAPSADSSRANEQSSAGPPANDHSNSASADVEMRDGDRVDRATANPGAGVPSASTASGDVKMTDDAASSTSAAANEASSAAAATGSKSSTQPLAPPPPPAPTPAVPAAPVQEERATISKRTRRSTLLED